MPCYSPSTVSGRHLVRDRDYPSSCMVTLTQNSQPQRPQKLRSISFNVHIPHPNAQLHKQDVSPSAHMASFAAHTKPRGGTPHGDGHRSRHRGQQALGDQDVFYAAAGSAGLADQDRRRSQSSRLGCPAGERDAAPPLQGVICVAWERRQAPIDPSHHCPGAIKPLESP